MMPTDLFDTHCHLTSPGLQDRAEAVVAAAVHAGVERLITVACQPEDFEPALRMRGLDAGLYVAVGIHPHEAGRASEADFAAMARSWGEDRVVAAGEMGLDYHYDFSPRDVQRAVFGRQLEMAGERNLPVIIHCREAQPDAVAILLDQGFASRPVVFHCFSGTPEEAAELRAHGWWTSFTGIITFKNCALQRQACIQTPLDQLMFETDSPYLAPEPVRKMRPNEPANLVHTVRFAAAAMGMSFEELAAHSTANALRFFRINNRER